MLTFITTPSHIGKNVSLPLNITPRRTYYRISTQQRAKTTMVSTAVVSEVMLAGALGGATYYFVFRDKTPKEKKEKEEKKETKEEPMSEKPEGVIGLTSEKSDPNINVNKLPSVTEEEPEWMTKSRSKSNLKKSSAYENEDIPSYLVFDSVGVNVDEYLEADGDVLLPEKVKRLEEELSWTAESLLDLEGCDAIVVFDSEKDILWETGDLISDTSQLRIGLEQTMKSNKMESFDLTSTETRNKYFPSLKDEVKTVVATPIGESGAYLVVGSRQKDFFSDVERRVVSAACSRLSSYIITLPKKFNAKGI